MANPPTIAIVFWSDAAIHGSEQLSRDGWKEESQLATGIAVGHIVNEDKEKITLAMDYFKHPYSDKVGDEQFRVVNTYPKSGISQIIRKKIEEEEE